MVAIDRGNQGSVLRGETRLRRVVQERDLARLHDVDGLPRVP